ncbi:MAG: hypothetical protein VR67_12080 [Peptococcaceae bacterium BRH_c8a]|nr:MAG: hypothetical protein VR67_12080 [Peptococcaceae bacterium BRH_c8a]
MRLTDADNTVFYLAGKKTYISFPMLFHGIIFIIFLSGIDINFCGEFEDVTLHPAKTKVK